MIEQSEECPFCVDEKGKAIEPFVPPYKLNQWLDNLSKRIKRKLTGPVNSWPYFISKYAKEYYKEYYKDNKSKKNKSRFSK